MPRGDSTSWFAVPGPLCRSWFCHDCGRGAAGVWRKERVESARRQRFRRSGSGTFQDAQRRHARRQLTRTAGRARRLEARAREIHARRSEETRGRHLAVPGPHQYGGKDVTLPIPLPIRWAGDTPIVVVDNVTLPGFGTVSARVMFFDDHYAGYWKHGDHSGHLFGVIRPGRREACGRQRVEGLRKILTRRQAAIRPLRRSQSSRPASSSR